MDVDQSLLDEIDDPYGEPVAEDLQITKELPALGAGDVVHEPIAPAEPVRADTPNLIETFYVPTGGIDATIDELPAQVDGDGGAGAARRLRAPRRRASPDSRVLRAIPEQAAEPSGRRSWSACRRRPA